MSELREHLEQATVELEALCEPPLRLSEVFGAIDAIGEVVMQFKPDGTAEEYKELLTEAVKWADEKFAMFEKIDEAIKVGPLLEPFDQTAIKAVVYQIAVPQCAQWLTELK